MSESVKLSGDTNGEFGLGKHVGDFEYPDGATRPVRVYSPEDVRIGDTVGGMDPREDGSFGLYQINPTDNSYSDNDIGPSADQLPDELPMQVWDPPTDEDSNDGWNDVVYRPRRGN